MFAKTVWGGGGGGQWVVRLCELGSKSFKHLVFVCKEVISINIILFICNLVEPASCAPGEIEKCSNLSNSSAT